MVVAVSLPLPPLQSALSQLSDYSSHPPRSNTASPATASLSGRQRGRSHLLAGKPGAAASGAAADAPQG